MKMDILSASIDIPQQLKDFCAASSAPVYAVGGLVRNALLGIGGGDLDISGPLTVEQVCGGCAEFTPINKRLGTAEISFKGKKFEYTRFRSEVYDDSGAHSPVSVSFDADLKEDALRRDFTVNAIYYDIKNDKIIDPLGGIEDIIAKSLRSHQPEKIFTSDGLRLMRLCRFSAELGFKVEPQTLLTAQKFADRLRDIAAERKREELDKILAADLKYGIENAHIKGIRLLHKLGLFKYILPSVEALDIPQNPKYHRFSVLEHTFKAVEYAAPEVRLAALMHDTGKPICQMQDGNMYNHAAVSEKIVKTELGQSGLKYSDATVRQTARLVRLHMYDKDGRTKASKMRLFSAENFDILEMLENLVIADRLATGMEEQTKPRFLFFKRLLLSENAPITIKDLEVDGRDAVAAGLKGAQIQSALKELLRDCIIDPKLNSREWLLYRLHLYAQKATPKVTRGNW